MYSSFKILKKHHAKKGQGAVDTMMAIIMFMMMLGGLICSGLYIYLQNIYYTAAREGARYAATDSNFAVAATQAQSIANIRQTVRNVVNGAGGATLADSNIQVSGPTGTVGQRTVTVTVSYRYNMPIQPMRLIRGFTHASNSGDSLDTFQVGSRSVMRYEE